MLLSAPTKAAGTALALTLLAFALRLYRLAGVEFWFDEGASWVIAHRPIDDIFTYVRNAVSEHPPIYYLALHTWIQPVGGSEFALRFLSVVFGVLLVPLMYRLARREFGSSVGLGVGLAAAASPFLFVYSQEARMYTLVPLLSVLTIGACLSTVRHDRARDWLALAGLLALGIGTHYYFALWIPAISLFLLARWNAVERRVIVRWTVLVFLLGAVVAFWMLSAPAMKTNVGTLLTGGRFAPWQDW